MYKMCGVNYVELLVTMYFNCIIDIKYLLKERSKPQVMKRT